MAYDDYDWNVREVTAGREQTIGAGDASGEETSQEAILVALVEKLRTGTEYASVPEGKIREQLLTGASEPAIRYWCACPTKSSCCNDHDYRWAFELPNGRQFLAGYSYAGG